jgi:hypothetical protein
VLQDQVVANIGLLVVAVDRHLVQTHLVLLVEVLVDLMLVVVRPLQIVISLTILAIVD